MPSSDEDRARLERHYAGAEPLEPSQRLASVRALRTLRDRRTTELLVTSALKETAVEVQVAAIELLAKRPGREVTSTLSALSRESDVFWVRQCAVRALAARTKDEQARVALTVVALREGEELRPRATAVEALAAAGDVRALFEVFERGGGAMRGEAAAGLRRLEYGRVAPRLLELAHGQGGGAEDVELARDALRLLAEFRDPAAIRELSDFARGNSAQRELAAELLARRAKDHPADCSCRDHPPGTDYYTSVRNDSGEYLALTGPWRCHEEAVADVERAREMALETGDPRAFWYGYGTFAAKPGAKVRAVFPLPPAILRGEERGR